MRAHIFYFQFLVFILFPGSIFCQCNLLPNAIPGITLIHQNTNCFNNSGVAYNPNLQLYYGVRAGNSGFPLETWSSTGVPLFDTIAGFDWRGMWWNPATNQLEGNGFNTFGMWKADLNASGYALSTGINLFSGMNQPDPQSCGDLDFDADEVLYYFNDYVYRYSRSTNAFLGSYQITGTPVATSNLNSTTLMYTGCPGKEIALLDYVNLAVYVYDKATGAYSGKSQLPGSAVTTQQFRTSWANCAVWLFDLNTYTWFSYKIFDTCAVCTAVNTIQNPLLCSGDSIFVGGNWQTGGGPYFDTLTAANGCDSIIASVLNIIPSSSSNQILSLCSGDSIYLGGAWQFVGGTYYDTLIAANSCDSIVTSTLNILTSVTSNQNFSICNGDSMYVGGAWQVNSGIYYDTLTATGGCDSVVVSDLTVSASFTTVFNLSVCSGDSVFAGGGWQRVTGTYYDTLSTANGCDSIITSNLIVAPFIQTSQNASICSGGTVYLGGAWRSSAGTYYDTLTTSSGCDSIIITTLTVNPAQVMPKSLSICQGNSVFLAGSWRTTAGIYRDTLTNSSGCDSIIATTLSIDSMPEVDLGNDTVLCSGTSIKLIMSSQNVLYLWQDNSTNPVFTVNKQGIYWLQASNNCGLSRDTIFVEEKNCDCSFYIPNSFTPNNDEINDLFMPAFDCPFTEYLFMIFDRWGEKLFETSKSTDSWDGKYKGRLSQEGVYLFAVTYKFDNKGANTKYGKVTLIR